MLRLLSSKTRPMRSPVPAPIVASVVRSSNITDAVSSALSVMTDEPRARRRTLWRSAPSPLSPTLSPGSAMGRGGIRAGARGVLAPAGMRAVRSDGRAQGGASGSCASRGSSARQHRGAVRPRPLARARDREAAGQVVRQGGGEGVARAVGAHDVGNRGRRREARGPRGGLDPSARGALGEDERTRRDRVVRERARLARVRGAPDDDVRPDARRGERGPPPGGSRRGGAPRVPPAARRDPPR